MLDIHQITDEILVREGGYVNDPDDPGGATNHGVTLGTLQRLGLDLNADGRVDVRDVRALSREQAADIFLRHYYYNPKINLLPEKLQPSIFDMYVNAGSNSVRILQRLLRQMGYDLRVDGTLGPQTARIAHAAAQVDAVALVDAYGIARRTYYFNLADRRPASRKYARSRSGGKGGWITRAEDFISPAFRLSTAEFTARVQSWGASS